ncbi:polyketide cyclase [Bosea caraganae]|uniref:Polyketide cyclase n=1 Tax=Bosea caraganae TaxID=2763117 RepID=A0A370L921_9HYPH|nr:SRPBCC family protein [Bosea caraganae]RDJ26746.1 polyketide cyclase [Bosea caraganae]RDJ30633.1 polyketide cyclase [Bosea caraganae]
MTDRSVVHATITVERTYRASPKRVFAAWSSKEALLSWGLPGEGWISGYERFDFRVGGNDRSHFGPAGGETYVNDTTYLDIVPDARIVSAGSMTSAGTRLSAGLMTVEFQAAGNGGCHLVMTEQGAFLDGHDLPENHEAGWNEMLDKLGDHLARDQAAA